MIDYYNTDETITIEEILELTPEAYRQVIIDAIDCDESDYCSTAEEDTPCYHCGHTIEESEPYYFVNYDYMCEECHTKKYPTDFEWELKILEILM